MIQGASFTICWVKATRTGAHTAGPSYQRYRGEEPNVDILTLGKTFCAGVTYEYRMCAKVISGGTTEYGPWGPIKCWKVQ